jgi:hypothetical protein
MAAYILLNYHPCHSFFDFRPKKTNSRLDDVPMYIRTQRHILGRHCQSINIQQSNLHPEGQSKW